MKSAVLVLLAALFVTPASVAGSYPCATPSGMSLQLEGAGILVTHHDAVYNCCMWAGYALTRDGARLILDETEHPIGGGCDCICCYQLAAHLANVPPGTWTVVLRGDGFEFTDSIVVSAPPPGEGDGIALGGYGQSVCGGTDIVGLDPPIASWGALKSAYR